MGQFVPCGGTDIEGTTWPRFWCIHHQQRPEGHAECTESSQAHCAYRKVGVTIEQLEPDRCGRPVLVARREGVVGLFQQRAKGAGQEFGISWMRHDLESRRADGAEFRELVEQVERVLVPQVIRIERKGAFEDRLALRHAANAQQVGAQRAEGWSGD